MELVSSIIAASAGAIVTLAIQGVVRLIRRHASDKNSVITRNRQVIKAIVRYMAIALFTGLLFVFVPFGKKLLAVVFIVMVFLMYLIAKDVLLFMLCAASNESQKEDLVKEREILYSRLAKQDDEPSRKKTIDRIKAIDKALTNKTYKDYS